MATAELPGSPISPTSPTPPILTVRDLTIAIDSDEDLRYAVKSLALTVQRGETFALVGESGSGKSMTAMALLRLLPDALQVVQGSIVLGQEDINALPAIAMQRIRGGRASMIFQEPGTSLNPVMRIGDQLLETIGAHTPLRGKAARLKAVQWLTRVGIPEPEVRIDDYPFQFFWRTKATRHDCHGVGRRARFVSR